MHPAAGHGPAQVTHLLVHVMRQVCSVFLHWVLQGWLQLFWFVHMSYASPQLDVQSLSAPAQLVGRELQLASPPPELAAPSPARASLAAPSPLVPDEPPPSLPEPEPLWNASKS
jgi:hypothetical protein